MTDSIICSICTMAFVVGEPPHKGADILGADVTRCAECNRPFWHRGRAPSNAIRVGMYPADAEAWGEHRETEA